MDDAEPDERRVQKDLKLIDEDKSGTIDRIEWISFIAAPEEEGRGYFNFGLKEEFDLHDSSN